MIPYQIAIIVAKKPVLTTSESKVDVGFTFPICKHPINKSGEDSVECEGSCATWVHRNMQDFLRELLHWCASQSTPSVVSIIIGQT